MLLTMKLTDALEAPKQPVRVAVIIILKYFVKSVFEAIFSGLFFLKMCMCVWIYETLWSKKD